MATKKLSERLRSYMRHNKLTQTDLAGMLKTSQANISRWLSGAAVPAGPMYAQILEMVAKD